MASFGGLPASHSWVPYARKSAAVTESTRQLHTSASAAPISAAVLGPNLVVPRRIGRVWGSGLAHGPLGAPGERQYDEECGKPSLPVHPFPPRRPIRRARGAPRIGSISQPIWAGVIGDHRASSIARAITSPEGPFTYPFSSVVKT